MDNPIDFVIPWVDGNDPEWRARKNKYTGDEFTDASQSRYRDWGLLPYWFRGVEKFAPWVRYIWFICDQEPPTWLNRNHPKLRIVRHEDYLPEGYRPSFSSHPIELNLHRIRDLSEQFVYFNDDTYLISPVRSDFYFKHGLPRDSAVLEPIMPDMLKIGYKRPFYICHNNAEYINRDYEFRKCVRKNITKWYSPIYGKGLIKNIACSLWPKFIGFHEPHMPQPFLKSSFKKAWEQDFDILDQASRHHLRHDHDVNQWLIRDRQLAEGRFCVRKPLKDALFRIQEDTPLMHQTIREQRVPMVCLGDTGETTEEGFVRLKERLLADFDTILKEPSSFEQQIII